MQITITVGKFDLELARILHSREYCDWTWEDFIRTQAAVALRIRLMQRTSIYRSSNDDKDAGL